MIALIWLVFLVGQAVHLNLQIWAIVTAPNSTAKTWSEVFYARGPAIIARSFLCTMLFWLWLDGQLVAGLDGLGIPLPGWVHVMLALHVSAPIAGLAGFVADSILAFIPWFKSTVPTV